MNVIDGDDIYYNIDAVVYFYSMMKHSVIKIDIDGYLSIVNDDTVIETFKKLVNERFKDIELLEIPHNPMSIVYVREELTLDLPNYKYCLVDENNKPANKSQTANYIQHLIKYCGCNCNYTIDNDDNDDNDDNYLIDYINKLNM